MSGCTTVSDHHYLYPDGLENAMDIQVEEATKLGIRMTVTRGSMSLSEKDGGLPPDSIVQDDDTILADCERVLNKYHDRSEGSMLQVALAPCAPFTVTKRLMTETIGLAHKHDCTCHTHLGETLDEDDYCLEHFGCRPVDYLEELGWMNERVWLATAFISMMMKCAVWGPQGSAYATVPRPTWCWRPAIAAPGNWRPPDRLSGLVLMVRHQMTIPT